MSKWKQVLFVLGPLALVFCLAVVSLGPMGGCPVTQEYIQQNVTVNPPSAVQGDLLPVTITSAPTSIFDLSIDSTTITSVSFGQGIVTQSIKKKGNHKLEVTIAVDPGADLGRRSIFVVGESFGTQYSGFIRNEFSVLEAPFVRENRTSHGSSVPSVTQGPVSLPSITVRSASLSSTTVAPGTPVIVTANVANTGTTNGSTRLTVYVNGQEESTRGITVNSGSNTPVAFTVTRDDPGVYTVYVAGTQAGSFTVDRMADPNIVLYVSGALLAIAFIVGLIVIVRRKQAAP